MTAGQTTDGLVYNSLENRSSQVFHLRTFVNQRLDIRLRKNAAAGCDWIYHVHILCGFIQTAGVCIQQNRHLVDKRTCTACTGTVHSLFDGGAIERNLGVFPAQLDSYFRFRNQGFYRLAAGNNFLLKVNAD